ncbi:sigma-70 family RNA polymerase sigma factor [Microlunatus sp. Gsoil 973]|uniref:sigma-70 family RNA polymerase sigma factor n=1 Tax=Microlunatus sp. Gsoil 973 TaxID=2672569 RepID=UPI001E2F6D5F|nr:sigma-70 family RNA polymerase sigma factor [Microlunatus sp. Gsoil 973]
MTADLITRARAGDEDAFRALTEPHRRELHVHCYRMLGSVDDADDVLQETLLAAWRGLTAYEERSSIRTWLYRIATNRCLNALRAARRRPVKNWDVAAFDPPEPTRYGEVPWLEALPDVLLEGAFDAPLGPAARYEQRESISLAFVTALQLLPPRQTAVLVLRDVLGFPAAEVAAILDTTAQSVSSALKRARATLARHRPSRSDRPPAVGSEAERALLERFVTAYEASDVDGLVTLLSDDVFVSMPPMPQEYLGREAATRFLRPAVTGRRFALTATRANAQPAFGLYASLPGGPRSGSGLIVLDLAGDRITALARFEPTVFPRFGLPQTWPAPSR